METTSTKPSFRGTQRWLVLIAIFAAVPAVAQKPTITSISKIVAQQQYQTITITGSNFGNLAPYSGDSDYIIYSDYTTGWECGYAPSGNYCGLIVNSWTDSQIVLGGFSLPYPEYLPFAKDDVKFQVFNAQSGDGPSDNKKATVILEKTTATISSSPNPSTDGQRVTFTAVIDSSIGAPPNGETVSFLQGKTVLGTGILSGGSASFSTSSLKVGTTSVTADYNGDLSFEDIKSKPVKQVVQ
jgi:hypothetical protein